MSEGFFYPRVCPISPNPYIVGNPVRDREMFFGREAEFELVRRRFLPPARGGLLVFCGERRSGKTSILFQILEGRVGPGFLPVLIDMQSMAVENEAEFLRYIAAEILSSLGPDHAGLAAPDFSGGLPPCSIFSRFVGELCRALPGRTLLLLFDEYELLGNKIDAGTLSEDVLHMLANIMEAHSVCIVFTGSQHIEQRKQAYWRLLGKSLYRVISYLQREDAVTLIRRPVEGKVRYHDGTIESIIRLTSGQPFYTQAICQSLMDHLNETGSNEVDPAAVRHVVDEIVENPFPQMIFLWDGLERDEKIALALLAERLETSEEFATVRDLLDALKAGDYALKLSRARVASALENLFKKEFLLKDAERAPGYAFRMDLWRLWIHRMHSVWQVLQEEGLTSHHRPGASRWKRWPAVAAAGALALFLTISLSHRRAATSSSVIGAGSFSARVDLRTFPEQAVITLDGNQVGIGRFRSLIAGGTHQARLSAPGYADTTLVLRASVQDSVSLRVLLRPLRGDLEVRTDPAGAEVSVDGRPRGRSPLVLRGLEVPRPHVVSAAMPGRAAVETSCSVTAGAVKALSLVLAEPKSALRVTTTPAGAEILVAGTSRGTSPLDLRDLPLGEIHLSARRAGCLPASTTLVLTSAPSEIQLALRPEPPGSLMVMGDSPATIYLDGALLKENVQNSGTRQLAAGSHHIQVVLVSGRSLEDTVSITSGELAVYDYSLRRVVRRSNSGGNAQ